MEAQTYSIFQAIGSLESLDLVLALLEDPGVIDDVRQRAGVSKSTASRRLDDLAFAGVVSRKRPRDPYEVALPELTRRFFEAAHELAVAILDARRESEERFAKRVRKTRLRPQEADDESAPA